MDSLRKLCPEGVEHFQNCCSEASLPSKIWSILYVINVLSPLVFVLCGIEWTNLTINIIATFLIYFLSDEKSKNVREFLKFTIFDMVSFWILSVVFGQPLIPVAISEVFYWCAWAGVTSNAIGRKLGFTANALGVIVLSPILTLDWMAWWQRWPIPGILGISIGQALAIVSASLFTSLRKK